LNVSAKNDTGLHDDYFSVRNNGGQK